MTYHEDTEMVVNRVRQALEEDTAVDINFRKQHRDGSIVWVHMQGKKIGEEDGCPLIQCVFHNITDLIEK
ncbi:PAS domain-containing protein, partial [Gordonibacter pamelaeae]|nr:PAS domain-containing protein [Gordonibacter pamelaeae]